MIKVYKDTSANVIIFDDGLSGTRPVGTLQCVGNGDNTVDVVNKFKETPDGSQLKEYSRILCSEFVDENDTPYGATEQDAVNGMNAMLSSSGGGGGVLNPSITSPLTVSSVEGDVINYELVADYGVGYEWSGLPSGLTTVEGNVRKLIGSLPAGVYTPTMKAINYAGEDSKTLTITVSNPPFSNSKSIRFNNNDYANASATTSNPFYRASNGSGVSDSWSYSSWFKPSTNSNSKQTLIMFGGSDQNNEGRVHVYCNGGNGKDRLELTYGSNNNNLEFETPNNSMPSSVWKHILITYDGGTTGSSSGSINNYYSRFKIYINGVLQSLTKNNDNYGWSGSIKAEYFRLCRNGTSSNYMRTGNLDEVALWSSDQSTNVPDIYNNGVPFDLSTLTTPPDNWWRMGDDDTFPTLLDSAGSLDFTMLNMTVSDIVNDVP